MADKDWPSLPWHLFQLTAEQKRDVLYVIEHSHRFAGYLVGCCSIVLAVWLWVTEKRSWLRWLGTAALGGVIIQGLVGGFRVLEHARWGTELRVIHGCFAQVVLGLMVGIAVFTSYSWSVTEPVACPPELQSQLWTWSLRTACLVWTQIALGVFLRQTYSAVGQHGHLLVAFAVVFSAAWLIKLAIYDSDYRDKTLSAAVRFLGVLLAAQVLLGVETWLVRFKPGGLLPELQPVTVPSAALRTAHFLVGSLLSVTVLVAVLWAYRLKLETVAPVAAPVGRLEEAA
jgi:cytochrome c oxidase assembly protein subunit 15